MLSYHDEKNQAGRRDAQYRYPDESIGLLRVTALRYFAARHPHLRPRRVDYILYLEERPRHAIAAARHDRIRGVMQC